jgi:hypothetical protein
MLCWFLNPVLGFAGWRCAIEVVFYCDRLEAPAIGPDGTIYVVSIRPMICHRTEVCHAASGRAGIVSPASET